MKRRQLLASLAVAPLLAAAPSTPQSFWDAQRRLVGTPSQLDAMTRFADAFFEGIDVDDALAAGTSRLLDDFTSLEIDRIYAHLPVEARDQWRGLGVSAVRNAAVAKPRLLARLESPAPWSGAAQGDDAPVAASRLDAFGHASLRVMAKPGGPQGLRVHADLAVRTDAMSLDDLAAYAADTLRAVETSARAGRDPALDFAEQMPAFAAAFARYGRVESVAAAAGARLELITEIQREPLDRDFPALDDFIDELGEDAWIRWRWQDRAGHELATGRLEAKSLRLTLSAPLPLRLFGEDGRAALVSDTDMHLSTHGVVLDMRGLRADVQAALDGAAPLLQARFTRPPTTVDVHGYAFGVIPVWLIDGLIPSSCGEMASDFARRITTGNAGRGTRLAIRDVAAAGGHVLVTDLDTELLGNGFLSFALRMQAALGLGDPAFWRDLLKLQQHFWTAYAADLRRRVGPDGRFTD